MLRNRATESIPTHACRDDFGLTHRPSLQAIRARYDESFQEPGGGRPRPGINSWLSARVMRIRGVKAR